jgi:hypothetical protein
VRSRDGNRRADGGRWSNRTAGTTKKKKTQSLDKKIDELRRNPEAVSKKIVAVGGCNRTDVGVGVRPDRAVLVDKDGGQGGREQEQDGYAERERDVPRQALE